MIIVRIEYSTDYDGRVLEPDEPNAVTLHGPFGTVEEADEWINGQPDDMDVVDYFVETVAADPGHLNDPAERRVS